MAVTEKPKCRPLGNRALLEIAPAEETSKGGIYLPDSAKDKPNKGKVVAVGTPKKDEPDLGIKPGDIVYYPPYKAVPMPGATNFAFLYFEDLVAVEI